MSVNRSTSPADIIETTQKLRLNLVDELTKGGTQLPTDGKDVNVLAGVLRDLDAAALTTRKLDVEEKGVDAATRAAANVAAVLKEMGGGNPFLGNRNPITVEGQRVGGPKPDMDQLPVIEMVPGHDRQGEDKLNYDEFVVDEAN